MNKIAFGVTDEKERQRLEDILDVFPYRAKIQKHRYGGYTLKLFVMDEKEIKAIAEFLRPRGKLSQQALAGRRKQRREQRKAA